MDEVSTFVWLGIALLWFLVKLFRRGSKKAVREIQRRTAKPDPADSPIEGPRIHGPTTYPGAGGTPPKPIEPR